MQTKPDQDCVVADARPTGRVALQSIVLTRADGPAGYCGVQNQCTTLHQANAILAEWSRSAPAAGSGDTCVIRMIFADGKEHVANYKLLHFSRAVPRFDVYLLRSAFFFTARGGDPGERDEHYRARLAIVLSGSPARATARTYETLLTRYEIGQPHPLPVRRFEVALTD